MQRARGECVPCLAVEREVRREVPLQSDESLTHGRETIRVEMIAHDILVRRAEVDEVAVLRQLVILKSATNADIREIARRDPGEIADRSPARGEVVAGSDCAAP